jgi:hypothetical protein
MRTNVIPFPQRRAAVLVQQHEHLRTWDVLVRWVDGRVTRESGGFGAPTHAMAEATELAISNGWRLIGEQVPEQESCTVFKDKQR